MVRVFYVFMLSILFFNMLLNLVMPLCLVFIFQHFIMSLCLIVSSLSMQVIEQYEQPQGKREVLDGEYGTDKEGFCTEWYYTEWETIDLGLRCRTRRTTRWRSGL